MKNNVKFLLLFVCFGLNNIVFAQPQRGGSNPDVSVVAIITHATCFNPNGYIEYEIVVSSEWENEASLNNIKLLREGDDVDDPTYQDNGPSLLGAIYNVGFGQYTLSGSISALDNQGMWVGISFSANIWLGIETIWTEKIDMILDPNNYSVKQNVVSNSLGGARSSNELDPATDGWIEMKAQFGTSTSSHVYWVIGETNPLGFFTANYPVQYIEFYKTTSGNGIQVRYKDFSGNYVISSISTNPNDKVRLIRSGSNLRVQLNDNNTTAFMFQQPSTGTLNIAVRSQEVGDGCVDVVSSFPCGAPKMFANLKYKLDGFYHIMDEGKIRFAFDQEYDSDDLEFNIYNHMDILVKDQDDFPPVVTSNGNNYLTIDVSDDSHCIGRGFFYLEVINSKKEKMYLRFLNDFQNQACTDYIGEAEPTE